MTDPQSWVAPIYKGLADLLTATSVDTWDAPSLCEKWLVRHVIAHVTMPARTRRPLIGCLFRCRVAGVWRRFGRMPAGGD